MRIGVAPCFMHADPARPIFKGKTLLYLEQSLGHWLMGGGAVPWLLPTPAGGVTADDLVQQVDGLVLQGGSDLAPGSYGQEPRRPEWSGDAVRDAYERELIAAAMRHDRPILGVCRGLQIINVALGGSLLQDLPGHRNWEIYDQLQHDISFDACSWLAHSYGLRGGRVNSVHHQAVDRLGDKLCVEARAADGTIEAVRYDDGPGSPFVFAVQWHPEFQDPGDPALLPTAPIRELFLDAVGARCAV